MLSFEILIIGLQQTLILFLVFIIFIWLNYKWKNAVAKKEEINRLVYLVSKESTYYEFESLYQNNATNYNNNGDFIIKNVINNSNNLGIRVPKFNQCAVCYATTTTRCSQCKSVHYCSGKCQIIHWRHGHKDECQPVGTTMLSKLENEFSERVSGKQYEMHVEGSESLASISNNKQCGYSGMDSSERLSEDVPLDVPSMSAASEELQEARLPPRKSASSVTFENGISRPSKSNRLKSSSNGEVIGCNSQHPKSKVMSDDARAAKLVHKKSIRRAASSEMLVLDASKSRCSASSNNLKSDTVMDNGEDDSPKLKGREARSLSFNASGDHTQDAPSSLRSSVWKKVQQLRPKQSLNLEITFPYELFVKLYSCDEVLSPFGLRNCGNSCYANTVIQCLAFTRPLTSYFVRGFHSKSCRKKGWCFNCEFQLLIKKAREGESPLSPIRILSKIQKIGSHLGHGREEDAHEFLRYAVDTMQSVFLKEAGSLGMSEETTLVGLTFGGYLQSKIKCMKCLGKSEIFERIMDLTVEIDGNIESLDQALTQFTADEMLDGENKYQCSRCKSFVKAKKKLTILEAPNILTIVLKRFQSDNFGKLNKSVRFPAVLDMAPYMCGRSDKSPLYSLYAVVVHRDTRSDASTGHYVCYIKTSQGDWFGINDSLVMPVELERVLSEEAYMLLYARHCPRAPTVRKSNAEEAHAKKLKKRILEAVPSNNLNTSKTKSNSHFSTSDPSKSQQKHDKYSHWMSTDDLTSSKFHDSNEWRFHHADSSSESSSLFSWSDASSCSTASTKDSVKSEDFSDFLFGDTGPSWYGQHGV